MRTSLTLLSIFILQLSILPAFSQGKNDQDSCTVSIDVSAEIVSNYVWRGVMADPSPNFQPAITLTAGNFQAGIWGSSNFNGSYREVDYWLSYSVKNFTLTVNDYFWTPYFDSVRYTNYDYDETGHFIETVLSWEGPESFPIKLTAATFVMGPDNKIDHYDSVMKITYLKNQYSTYFEASYPFQIKETELNAFMGGTPAEGYYGDGPGIVNLGITVKKTIPLTEKFGLPISTSLILNPQTGNAFIVLGLTL